MSFVGRQAPADSTRSSKPGLRKGGGPAGQSGTTPGLAVVSASLPVLAVLALGVGGC